MALYLVKPRDKFNFNLIMIEEVHFTESYVQSIVCATDCTEGLSTFRCFLCCGVLRLLTAKS